MVFLKILYIINKNKNINQMKKFLTELLAGISTFSTMSYIIFVQPAVLSSLGMDFNSVIFATCISTAIATLLMALSTNLPFALAPAMGHNFFFAFVICGTMGFSWREALAINLFSGLVFVFLSIFGIVSVVTNSFPQSLKSSIAVGIGLMIAFVGLQWGGIVIPPADTNTITKIGDIKSAPFVATMCGLLVSVFLYALGIRFSLIFGIATSTFVLWFRGYISFFEGIISHPPSPLPTLLKYDFASLLSKDITQILTIFFVLLILDIFDSIGTFIGLFEVGKIKADKKTIDKAFLSDAIGTVIGTALGTSTVTTYVESSAGIQAGGKTKITSIVVSILFVAALFFTPLTRVIGGGIDFQGRQIYPTIACALILIGLFMTTSVKNINWDDLTEGAPAILTILFMAFSLSITEGIALGIISHTLLKLLTGRIKETNIFMIVLSLLFAAKYLLLTQ